MESCTTSIFVASPSLSIRVTVTVTLVVIAALILRDAFGYLRNFRVREGRLAAPLVLDREGDAGELDRLMRVDGTLRRMQVVSVIRAGEADNVVRALVALRWRGTFYRDVRDDIDRL